MAEPTMPVWPAINTLELGDRLEETGDRLEESGDRLEETGDRFKESGDRLDESDDIVFFMISYYLTL